METSSSSHTIEFTVLSGEDLRINRRSVKRNTFVVVKTERFNNLMTKMDTQGGSYPSWNEKFVVKLPMHERFITVEVQCKSSSGNKSIGFAKIPVSDFMGGYVPENYLHFLSYRLRDVEGDKNGIINVSARVVNEVNGHATCSAHVGWKAPDCSSQRVQGYATWSWTSQERFDAPIGRVVTGVPVWITNHEQIDFHWTSNS